MAQSPTNQSDTIMGNAGDDTLRGRGGHDRIFGLRGDDRLLGEQGNDTLLGGNGNDTLLGGDGADHLYGEGGDDVLFGGRDSDSFHLNSISEWSTMQDYNPAEDLVFINDVPTRPGGGGPPVIFPGSSLTLTDGALIWDADGEGAEEPIQIARISPLVRARDIKIFVKVQRSSGVIDQQPIVVNERHSFSSLTARSSSFDNSLHSLDRFAGNQQPTTL
ncbi:MAG: hypothetical protein Kow00121_13070 [Elainellaceae cyanobacterium]